MKTLVLASCVVLSLASPVLAHGGLYRGPPDVVPPRSGGKQPNGPRGTGPTDVRPPGPKDPTGPAGPHVTVPGLGTAARPQGPITRNAALEVDLNTWSIWWGFHKDPFLSLKRAIHTGPVVTGGDDFWIGAGVRSEARDSQRPTDGDVQSILPELRRALDATQQRDIVSSCLVAMAKIGKDHETFRILDVIRPHLAANNQEVQETAAIAMGITQMPEAVEDLADIARDTARGRRLCATAEVSYRTRSFACYGLGLIAHAVSNADCKRRCFAALADVLERTTHPVVNPNIPVAAINGIRLLQPNRTGADKDRELRDDCVRALWELWLRKDGEVDAQVRAHVPPAVAQLLGRGGEGPGPYKAAFADVLSGRAGKRDNYAYQSAAIALGVLCRPAEEDPADAEYSEALLRYSREGKDEQARYFALIALARIGGMRNRDVLLDALAHGSSALVKPWAATALGVWAFERTQAGGDRAAIETIGEALRKRLDAGNPATLAAIAVGLGLCKYRDAGPEIEELLAKHRNQDELAGHLCIALALMEHRGSIDYIRQLVASSVRRSDLLQQAAIALGKMGDKEVADQLQAMLEEGGDTVAKLSAIASALGFIGDRRSIAPLVAVLQNEKLTDLSRAFAAVALGGVGDKENLPWNAKIAENMNYRAAVDTLFDQVSGVLDIL